MVFNMDRPISPLLVVFSCCPIVSTAISFIPIIFKFINRLTEGQTLYIRASFAVCHSVVTQPELRESN